MMLRIGEIAERTGVTPRTIRYYEELGLLPTTDRAQGKHRTYTDADVDRRRELSYPSAMPGPSTTRPMRARNASARANSASSAKLLSCGMEISKPPAVCGS